MNVLIIENLNLFLVFTIKILYYYFFIHIIRFYIACLFLYITKAFSLYFYLHIALLAISRLKIQISSKFMYSIITRILLASCITISESKGYLTYRLMSFPYCFLKVSNFYRCHPIQLLPTHPKLNGSPAWRL